MGKNTTLFKLFILAIISIMVITGSVLGIAADALTLKQCFEFARVHNEQVQITLEEKMQALQLLRQAKGKLLPDIRARYLKDYDRTDPGISDESSESYVILHQPIFAGFSNTKAIAISASALKSAEYREQNYLRVLCSDIAHTFYGLMSSETDMRNIQQTVDLMNERLQNLKDRVRLGKSRESETLLVESRAAELQAQEEQIRGIYAIMSDRLLFLIGLGSALPKLIDDAPAVETVESLETYRGLLSERSDILEMKERIAMARHRLAIVRSDYMPSVDLDITRYITRDGEKLHNEWNAELTLDMPLFQGGITRAQSKEILAQIRAAEQALSYALRAGYTEIAMLYHTFTSSRAQFYALQTAYEKAQASYRAQLKDYGLGLVDIQDVLTAMLSELEVKQNFDRSLFQVKLNAVLLDIALGKL